MYVLGVSVSGCNVSIIERVPVSECWYLLERVSVNGCNVPISTVNLTNSCTQHSIVSIVGGTV